jgi:transcriptional regulator with XRE-family HTH domain
MLCRLTEEVKPPAAQQQYEVGHARRMAKWTEDIEAAARFRGHLRQQMSERAISRTELARRLDSDSGNLTRILNGERVPTIGMVLRACRVLRLSPTRVLEESPPPTFDDTHNPPSKRGRRRS